MLVRFAGDARLLLLLAFIASIALIAFNCINFALTAPDRKESPSSLTPLMRKSLKPC